MITLLRIWDAYDFNVVQLDEDNGPYPVKKFTWEYPMVGDDIQRPFTAGRYDTRKSVGSMTIDMEGVILATSTAAYWTSRKALLNVVLPPIDQTIYKHSTIEMQIDGDPNSYHADVQLSSFSIPLSAEGSPTVSPFMFSWTCNAAYWKDSSQIAVRL